MRHTGLQAIHARARALASARARALTSAAEKQNEMIASLVDTISAAAKTEVPWFHKQMPPAYFRQVAPARRDAHLRAITALSAQGITVPEVQLRDTSGKGFTFITDRLAGDLNHIVERQLRELPAELGLRRVMIYQSLDARLGLNVFDTKEEGDTTGERRYGAGGGDPETLKAEAEAMARIQEYAAKLQDDRGFAFAEQNMDLLGACVPGGSRSPRISTPFADLDNYAKQCSSSYVVSHAETPSLLCKQMTLFNAVAGGDDMGVTLERYNGPDGSDSADDVLLTLAIPETTPRKAIQRAILMLNLHSMQLVRAQVDVVRPTTGADVVMLRTVARKTDGSPIDTDAVVRDAARIKWVGDYAFTLASASSGQLVRYTRLNAPRHSRIESHTVASRAIPAPCARSPSPVRELLKLRLERFPRDSDSLMSLESVPWMAGPSRGGGCARPC